MQIVGFTQTGELETLQMQPGYQCPEGFQEVLMPVTHQSHTFFFPVFKVLFKHEYNVHPNGYSFSSLCSLALGLVTWASSWAALLHVSSGSSFMTLCTRN